MKSLSRLYLVRSLIFLLFGYWIAYLYINHAGDWIAYGYGILTLNPKIYQIEIPFFLMLASLVYFPSVKSLLLRNLLPLVPVLVLYGLFDTFYSYFGRVATPSDFSNMFEIFSFSIGLALGLIFLYLLIPLSIFLSVYFNHNYTFLELRKSLLNRFLLLLALAVLFASPLATHFQNSYFNYTVWAQEDTIRENGRFNSSLFYAKQEYNNSQVLVEFAESTMPENEIKNTLFPGEIINKKNIHIIVLESFMDPRLIEELDLDASFIASELLQYLGPEREFSHVIAPIYGGGTAQSEFELLTGIKALAKVNQIEFNVMQGQKTESFVNILRDQNYFTHATIAPSSEYFNSKRAYQSLGFDQVRYLQEGNLIEKNNFDETLFDGDLLNYNLEFIRAHIQLNKQPLLNYVLGMYGHLPFKRNLQARPDVVSKLHPDERINRIANQFYYRTIAIANFLQQLTQLDPNSIIVITSDHLPSVLGSNSHYALDNKINIALMLDAGAHQTLNGNSLYQIPWLVWDKLSDYSNKRELNELHMEKFYFTLLSQSLQKNEN